MSVNDRAKSYILAKNCTIYKVEELVEIVDNKAGWIMYEGNRTIHFCEPSIRLTVYPYNIT